jgi:hypothetical protein
MCRSAIYRRSTHMYFLFKCQCDYRAEYTDSEPGRSRRRTAYYGLINKLQRPEMHASRVSLLRLFRLRRCNVILL